MFEDPYNLILYLIIFTFGITVGSFLNVCIYRIPKNETIVTESSHCMSCGKRLRWYELIPLFSWLIQGGKCRGCGAKISVQYPLIEAANGILWVISFAAAGMTVSSIIYCLMVSSLLALSVIDGRTLEIPFGFNVYLAILGIVFTIFDRANWSEHVIGFFAVSIPLLIVIIVTNGQGMGGGDMKLMASCGLIIGWKLIVLAFFIGCIIGAVIHVTRMKFFNGERTLAMGPYLSAGIFISALWGNKMIDWYIGYLI